MLSTLGRIFISKDVYNRTFRKYGLAKEGFWLRVRLNKAMIGGKEVEIYTKRDIEVRYEPKDP